MKTAEEHLKENWHVTMIDDVVNLQVNMINAMHEYATQEVEKHLKIAADEATYHKGSWYIDKQSITGIKINLT